MLRTRRSQTEYGWIIGDRLIAAWPPGDDPPAGWERPVPGSGTITRTCDGTETGHPRVIGYAYSALSPTDRTRIEHDDREGPSWTPSRRV
jgi:hypothetical protein